MSNNTMTIRQPAAPTPASNPASQALAALPVWLQYLIAAYPAAQVLSMTYLVYEEQFADVDADTMMLAVKAAVRQHKYSTFPAVADIRQQVEAIGAARYMSLVERAGRLRSLQQRRRDLEQRSFDGNAAPDEFAALAVEFDDMGYEATANSVRVRGMRYGDSDGGSDGN